LATALAVGKLMKLNEDKLANALSIAFVPHLPMFVSHVGALSMWKGCHSAMGVRNGVYAALLAREGMTGPAQPFEARGGWFDNNGAFKQLRLPANPDGQLGIENFRLKQFPAEGSTQGTLELIPSIREWTKVDEIASIRVEVPFNCWQEVGDPPKWDPQNRETADHSLAYLIAVALTDGEIYLSSFKPERYLHDASVRQLMQKITVRPNPEFKADNRSRLTLRKNSGEQLVKDAFDYRDVTHDDVIAKFNRICAYTSVSNEQRDRALATWPNLRKVQDIAEPMREMANFGKPLPL
jgi:2-methylcitrate dehydratase